MPRQFCTPVLRFASGFHPATSLEAAPAIGVRLAPELGVLSLLPVWYKSVDDCLDQFAPHFLVDLVPLLAKVAVQSLHQLVVCALTEGSSSFAARLWLAASSLEELLPVWLAAP